jgi:hypothetical protein
MRVAVDRTGWKLEPQPVKLVAQRIQPPLEEIDILSIDRLRRVGETLSHPGERLETREP